MSFTLDEREKIQAAYEQSSIPAVPDSLKNYLDGLVDVSSQETLAQDTADSSAGGWGRYAAMAACVCVGIAGGVLLSQFGLQKTVPNRTTVVAATDIASTGITSTSVHQTWVQRVADYQSLYTEKTIAALSPTREADALRLLETVNQLKPTRTGIPDLTEFGYTFARAQQLGFNGTPLVQLVYAKPGSAPMAFCYMSGDTGTQREFQVADVHGLGTASWATGGQHFVLVGDEPASVMSEIHRAIEVVF